MLSHSTLIGAAGQHYVIWQLLRHGWVAALAPEGVPNVDIIVTDIKARHQFSVQIKARSGKGNDKGWHMKAKHEHLKSKTLFYCFVDFEDQPPTTYIIPAAVVAQQISLSHRIWLSKRGKKNKKHKDNPIRRLLPDYSKTLKNLSTSQAKNIGKGWISQYRENWKLLEL